MSDNYIKVDLKSRTIDQSDLQNQLLNILNDTNVNTLSFKCVYGGESIETHAPSDVKNILEFGTGATDAYVKILFRNAKNDEYYYSCSTGSDYTFTWKIDSSVTNTKGIVTFNIQFFRTKDNINYHLSTLPSSFEVKDTLNLINYKQIDEDTANAAFIGVRTSGDKVIFTTADGSEQSVTVSGGGGGGSSTDIELLKKQVEWLHNNFEGFSNSANDGKSYPLT